MEPKEEYRTTDIGVAAYFKIKGIPVAGYERGAYIFNISETEARKLAIEFSNSEFSKFDHAVRALKKLNY